MTVFLESRAQAPHPLCRQPWECLGLLGSEALPPGLLLTLKGEGTAAACRLLPHSPPVALPTHSAADPGTSEVKMLRAPQTSISVCSLGRLCKKLGSYFSSPLALHPAFDFLVAFSQLSSWLSQIREPSPSASSDIAWQ